MWAAIPTWEKWAILLLSLIVSAAGLGLAGFLIVRMPEDHFIASGKCPPRRHPAIHFVWICLRNLLGLALIIGGAALLVLPGPGMLSIILGLSIMDFPGKRWLLTRTLQWGSVRKTLNWIRKEANRPPLKFPPRPDQARDSETH